MRTNFCIFVLTILRYSQEIFHIFTDTDAFKPKKLKKMKKPRESDKVLEIEDTTDEIIVSQEEENKKPLEKTASTKPLENVEDIRSEEIKETKKPKLTPMKIERMTLEVNKVQHAENTEGPQFTKLKLKKSSQKPKQEVTTVTLPKFQLKSRIKYVNDWPPQDTKPSITFIGSVRQNGELSRNMKEASKIKKKPLKLPEIADVDKTSLEEPEKFEIELEPTEISSHEILEPKKTDVTEDEIKNTLKKKATNKPTLKEQKIEIVHSKETDLPERIDDITEKSPEPEDLVFEKNIEQQHEVKVPEENEFTTKLSDENNSEKIIEEERPQKPTKPKTNRKKDQEISNESAPIETPIEEEVPQKATKPIRPKTKKEEKDIPSSEEPAIVKELQKEEESEKDVSIVQAMAEMPDELETDKTKPHTEKKPKKLKKKGIAVELAIDLPKEEVVISEIPEEISSEYKDKKLIKIPKIPKDMTGKAEEIVKDETLANETPVQSIEPKKKLKLTPIKIERKTLKLSEAQHAENVESPQFTQLKLKKTIAKPKRDSVSSTLPKFQLKSRITHVRDWPPEIIKPIVNYLGSIRQNGILSRNVKEAAKIKKKVYKQPELPDIERTELEKPMFGYEDIAETQKAKTNEVDKPEDEPKDDEPEQVTLKPRRQSIKKTEEIVDEVTIKKKLKPLRKSSVTLPEITEPENVTFRPKTTKTKEDVEQEFNIHLDSYAEEEISMSSKVKLKPQRHPTFNEEADEASIKFYTEEDEEGPEIVEIIGSDIEEEHDMPNIMMQLKKPQNIELACEEIEDSAVTIIKPRQKDQVSEITQDVNITLDRKPKYITENQEEVSFDVKAQKEQYTQEELSLSSKIKLKPRKKKTMSEAADETSIKITQEIEDDSQQEEIIISEAESEENIEMFIKRKPKKPAYEVSEMEELSVELKPSRKKEDIYEEEQLTILAKRKPRKPSQLQGRYQLKLKYSTRFQNSKKQYLLLVILQSF